MKESEAIKKHFCPVCGFNNLKEPVRGKEGEPSFEICPSCGVEFGVDDDESNYEELRGKWLKLGAKWYSKRINQPENWNGQRQCEQYLKDSLNS